MANCFVIQGFGKKTDYTNGRELDLDLSYQVIKTAVEAAGVKCVRADEIIHSGVIDTPMYEHLLNADLVIADLSTYNINAAFELGVRYALKPYSTIVLAEKDFKSPFDVNHIVIRRYEHLGGPGVSFTEANRLIAELKTAIETIINAPKPDSPVYIFLPHLKPPSVQEMPAATAAKIAPDFFAPSPVTSGNAAPAEVANIIGEDNPSAKVLLDAALDKINASDFSTARPLLEEVNKLRPNDSFVIQQLALATYKSNLPSPVEALKNAHAILQQLTPESSNNPETLGLWGAVHKRLWEQTGKPDYLEESISSYGRGFYLKQDPYNGINLSYLLNVRAIEMLKKGNKDEAIADFIIAKRIRQDVIRFTIPLIERMDTEEKTAPLDEKKKKDLENKRYWLVATLWEAAIGMGDINEAAKWEHKAMATPVASWMQATRAQGEKLRGLLTEYSKLVETAS